MSWTDVAKTPRRIHRMTQILQVLAKHGFGHFVHYLNLQAYLPISKRLPKVTAEGEAPEPETLASRTRMVLQELGPTFVKLGQLLSTRPDLLPEDFITEFSRLQDQVEPFPAAQAIERIEQELGRSIDEVFGSFEREPRASGSIGQVHNATLRDGREVVVKVKRPGIEAVVRGDMDMLGLLAERAEAVPDLRVFRPKTILEEFHRAMQQEMDYVSEASNTAKFYDALADRPGVRSAQVHWDYTTSSVLTLDRLSGEKLQNVERLAEMGVDPREMAQRMLDTFFYQFFEAGFFHADPHPGNLLVTSDGVLELIDFGMVGRLGASLRSQLGTALIGIARQDMELILDVFTELGVVSDPMSAGLRADMQAILDKYYGIPIRHMDTARVFHDVMRVTRTHNIVLPRDFVLLGKALVTITGLAKSLDPELNVRDTIAPYAKALVREKLSPKRIAKVLGANAWYLSNLLGQLPREIRQLFRKVLGGDLEVAFRHEGLEHFISEIDRASNRLAFSVLVASIVIGSSLIIHANIGFPVLGVSGLGLFGYLTAFVLGVWLLIAILRSGRL